MEGLVDKLCHRFSNVQPQATAVPSIAAAGTAAGKPNEEQQQAEEEGNSDQRQRQQQQQQQQQQQREEEEVAHARMLQQWRTLAFCLSLLPLSERGVKRLADNLKLYSKAIADEAVMELMRATLSKVRGMDG